MQRRLGRTKDTARPAAREWDDRRRFWECDTAMRGAIRLQRSGLKPMIDVKRLQ